MAKPRCKNCEFLIDDPRDDEYRCGFYTKEGNVVVGIETGFCDKHKERKEKEETISETD